MLRKTLRQPVTLLLDAADLSAMHALVERHPELLSDEAQAMLEDVAVWYAEQADTYSADRVRRQARLLTRCRDVGVQAAFAAAGQHEDLGAPGRALLDTAAREDARWEREHDIDALRRAARAWADLATLTPRTEPGMRAGAENEAAIRLLKSYRYAEDEQDLIAARTLLTKSVAGTASSDLSYGLLLGNLGAVWQFTYERSEDRADLQRALDAFEKMAAATPAEAPHRPAALTNLAIALRESYRLHGGAATLDRAVNLDEEALRGLPPDSADRAIVLNGLANGLSLRYDRRKDPADVNRLVAAREEAMRLVRPGTPQHAVMLDNLSNAYSERAEAMGNRADLDQAVRLAEQAIAEGSQTSSQYGGRLSSLASKLHSRYLHSGNLAELRRSIELKEQALSVAVPHGQLWLSVAHNLAVSLRERFSRLGELDDLERVIAMLREVVTHTPAAGPDASKRYESLGNALRARYLRTRRDEDLGQAIEAYEMALALVPIDGAAGTTLFTNIGSAVNDRYDARGEDADLRRANHYYTEAARHARQGTAEHRNARNNIGRLLASRARRTGSAPSWQEAETIFQEVVDQTPDGRPEKLIHLSNLAVAQMELSRATAAEETRHAAVSNFRTILAISQVISPDQGLQAALAWGQWAADRDESAEAAEAYRAGLSCLRALYRRQGRRDQKEIWLGNAAGLTPAAAYALARSGDLEAAVVAAETGRAVMLTEALDRIAIDLEALSRAGHATLAADYQSTVQQLAVMERAAESEPGLQAEKRSAPSTSARELSDSAAALVERIQAVPEFEDFQRPPTYDSVTAAAALSPIVYLAATDSGAIALLVDKSGCEAIRLPALTNAALAAGVEPWAAAYTAQRHDPARWQAALLDLTEWLWPVLMEPVIAALADRAHAVLVPMGVLGQLPLHAAWRSDPTVPCGRRYAMDEVMLTYAPNARSLSHARKLPRTNLDEGVLAVADPQPVNASPLYYANREADTVMRLFARGRRLAGAEATRDAVLAELSRWPILHFACHAHTDTGEPLNSALLLANNEEVNLRDLIRSDTFHPDLVVLSACETALSGAELPDEVVSLPSGFLQSGARAVIGSFWPVYDESAALLMDRFYQIWRTHEPPTPAVALRAAQQWMRDTPPQQLLATLDPRSPWRDLDVGKVPLTPAAGLDHPVHWAAFAYVGS